MSEYKRGVVTDLNREESKRLRAIWDSRSNRMTQAEFGQTYGIGSQAAVGHFLNGHAAISLKAAKGFAHGLGCEISEFSERLADQAAELGEVSGAGGGTDVMSLSRDELHLLMLYRRLQPLHQRQIIATAAEMLKNYLMSPILHSQSIDDLVEWDGAADDNKKKIKRHTSTTKL